MKAVSVEVRHAPDAGRYELWDEDALIGGLMLGVLEGLVSLMVPNGTAMVELAAYGLMIFVLLIRPGGLMGVKEG